MAIKRERSFSDSIYPRALTCIAKAIAEAGQSRVGRVTPEFIVKYCLKKSVTPGIESDTANVFTKGGVKWSSIHEAIRRIEALTLRRCYATE